MKLAPGRSNSGSIRGPQDARLLGPANWCGSIICLALLVVGVGRHADAADTGVHGQYLGPSALAVSRDGRWLYAACQDARQVLWVELPGGAVARRVALPGQPTALLLTADQSRLIAICAAATSTIAVLDAESGELLAAIPAGHTATGAALSPDGSRLYVCDRFDNHVSVIDLAAGESLARVRVQREPVAAAVTPDGKTLLVANHLADTRTDDAFQGDVAALVTVIDTGTLETESIELPHGASSLRGLCIAPDGSHALVTHLLSNFQMIPFRVDTGWINVNVVSILDIGQRKVVATIGMDEYDRGAGNPWGVTWSRDGSWVYVSVSGTHELCAIESQSLLSISASRTMQPMMAVWPIYPSLGKSLWRRIPLPGKGPRALLAADSKIFVAEYFSDSVAVVDHPPAEQPSVTPLALGPTPRLTERRRGELLFHDATICYQHWQSCASCHPDARADALNWDLMNDGVGNSKNTKSMLLSHQTPPAMAEGVRENAEVAVRAGLTHILFAVQPEEDAMAIDAYLRSLVAVPSPRLVDGRLSPSAERGRALFESPAIACTRCHPAPLYTDLESHNVGSRSKWETHEDFDSPTLIEVWRTAPYLHDGRHTTLEALLRESRHGLPGQRGDALSDQDWNDLIEYVLSL